jgi:SecD/SecF fusion protein
MRHLVRNIFVALALIILSVAAFSPPSKKIKLGKDLEGGSSLIYSVQMDRTENADEVIPKVIDVLKRRIDPNGLFEISIVRQGQDRVEITMPLPGKEVQRLRADFEAELAKLAVASVDAAEFEQLMRTDAGTRAAEIERAAGGNAPLLAELTKAAEAYDRGQTFRVQLEIAERNNAPEAALDTLTENAAQAEIAYEIARDRVLAAGISPDDVRRALELSDEDRELRDNETDSTRTIKSPRKRALERIAEEHPELAGQLEVVKAAYEVYSENRGALDDTSDLKRLVQASGELNFRIAVDAQSSSGSATHPEEARLREELREKGPRLSRANDAKWYKLNKLDGWYTTVQEFEALDADPALYFASRNGLVVEEFAGDLYMLCFDSRGTRMTAADGQWKISRSFQTQDQLGRPAIGFQMDTQGANRLGDLTGNNVGNSMAVLLDDEVYTAPNLNSKISSNGIIEGEFSTEEINYIIRVMTAGSLQAKLSPEPISESTIAPELGADNLGRGLNAGLISLVVVGGFMIFYYFGYGTVAVICLLANGAMIVGALALSRAALTLPGIAGIVLTFGMAVDANVLIYERVREELRKGIDLRTSVRLGYEKALSSIVDGNVTNLIVCFVLANVGTQEIRGFAITLGIGVVCTMISAVFFSRIIMTLLIDKVRIRKMGMLATAFPVIDRVLEPRIDWMKLRFFFVIVSVTFVGLGVVMVATRGKKMLDTEFRGGTQVTMTFKEDGTGDRMTLDRSEVEAKVRSIGEANADNPLLAPLRNAEIVAVNPRAGGLTSDTFSIKTTSDARPEISAKITEAFQDKLDAPPPLDFRSSAIESAAEGAPVYPVLTGRLGDDIGRPEFRDDISAFSGGAVIVVENMQPTQTVDQLQRRLSIMRGKEDFVDALGRQVEVRVLDGNSEAVRSALILVLDPGLLYLDNSEAWQAEVAQREWDLARAALTTTSDSLSVQNFSAAIAADFRQKAIVAVALSLLLILIYIWVRFGSVRYSLAAIATLTHDVFVALGLIALTEIIYDAHIAEAFARALLIEPFKIDLNMVAAMLTIIGYSLNDTIIIMDRIRENRGKLSYVTRDVVNLSINQTISRTTITSGTTLLAVLILYIVGGPGVRAFSFTLLVGVLFGTYSSIAVAAPLVWARRQDISAQDAARAASPAVS